MRKIKKQLKKELNQFYQFEKLGINSSKKENRLFTPIKKEKNFKINILMSTLSFASLIFVIISLFGILNTDEQPSYNTYLMLNVNPTFEIALNQDDQVTDVKALNNDAVYVLYEQDIDFDNLEDTISFLEERIRFLEIITQDEDIVFEYAFLTEAKDEQEIKNRINQRFNTIASQKTSINFDYLPAREKVDNKQFFSSVGSDKHPNFDDSLLERNNKKDILENILDFREEKRANANSKIRDEVEEVNNHFNLLREKINDLKSKIETNGDMNYDEVISLIEEINEKCEDFSINLEEINSVGDIIVQKGDILGNLNEYDNNIDEERRGRRDEVLKNRGRP